MPPITPHPTNGHGYVHVDLVGNPANKDQGEAALVARKDAVVPNQAIVRVVSRMQGGASHGAMGDRVIILAEAQSARGAPAAHTEIQNLQNSIAADAAHFGLAQHWCCYSDH